MVRTRGGSENNGDDRAVRGYKYLRAFVTKGKIFNFIFSGDKISFADPYCSMPRNAIVTFNCLVWMNFAKNNDDTIEKCRIERELAQKCLIFGNETTLTSSDASDVTTAGVSSHLESSTRDVSETSTEAF